MLKKILLAAAFAAFAFVSGASAQGTANCQALAGGTRTAIAGNIYALACDTSGNLKVTFAGTVTVTGTVAATQSGAWNVGITGTLPAFAAIPTFKIDQTTPGTTNGVVVNSLPATPAGSNIIGNVRIDQTTPGTTNGVQDAATSATGAAVPAKAILAGARSGANIVELIQASASAAINVSTATTTQLVALSGSTKIYVTSFDVISGGTGNITFVYGTGSNCGTGTVSLTGAYPLTAQAGIAKGGGLGPVLIVPAGNALCATTSAAVQMSGSVSYTQF